MAVVQPYYDPNVKNPKRFDGRKSYWIEGGLEANHCDSVTSLLYLIDYLAHRAPQSVKRNQYYILPLLNPEGYEFSRQVKKDWMKNREKATSSLCFGVNINRNFPPVNTFNLHGSNDTCSEEYRGPSAGSSEEVQTHTVVRSSASQIKMGLSIVSSDPDGPQLLYPVAYHDKDIPEKDEYEAVGQEFVNKMRDISSVNVGLQSHGKWRMASGTSADFAYSEGNGGLSFSYAMPKKNTGTSVKQKGKQFADSLFAMLQKLDTE